jgi:hypothetical protein
MDHQTQTTATQGASSDREDPHQAPSVPAAFAQSSGFAAVARSAPDARDDDCDH